MPDFERLPDDAMSAVHEAAARAFNQLVDDLDGSSQHVSSAIAGMAIEWCACSGASIEAFLWLVKATYDANESAILARQGQMRN